MERINLVKNVQVITNATVKVVDLQERMIEIEVNKESKRLKFDTVIASWHIQAPNLLTKSGLVDKSGLITVDASTLESSFEGISVIGDCAHIVLPSKEIHPKSHFFTLQQAKVVASRISDVANGKSASSKYVPKAKFELSVNNDERLVFQVDLQNPSAPSSPQFFAQNLLSQIEDIEFLFTEYFAPQGGNGFTIFHSGKKFEFAISSKVDTNLIANSFGLKPSALLGVLTQDGQSVKFSDRYFAKLVNGKTCVLQLRQEAVTRGINQTIKFYSVDDDGDEARKSMIAWLAHPSQLNVPIISKEFHQHTEETKKEKIQHNWFFVHYIKNI